MNKKTLRIAGWALGLSMAVAGLGAAVVVSNGIGEETAIVKAVDNDISLSETTTGTSYTSAKFDISSGGATNSSYYQLGNASFTSKSTYRINGAKDISYSITTRKFGGPSDSQAVVNLSLIKGSTIVATASFSPNNTTLKAYTGKFTVTGDTDGVKFVIQGNGKNDGSKGVGISSISFTATSLPEGELYSVVKTISNGTATGATQILENGEATVTIVPNDGYKLPTDVNVTGATKSYNSSTGVITLSNPTGNVTITATCPAKASYSVASAVENGTSTGPNSYLEGEENIEVVLSPNVGYKLPTAITLFAGGVEKTEGVDYLYDAGSGSVLFDDLGGNVSINASMDEAASYSITSNVTNLTATGATSLYENQNVTVTLAVTDSQKYALPTSITITGQKDYEYNSSTGVITIKGASGNVTIIAAASHKPAIAADSFDFPSSGSGWTEVVANKEYRKTVGLITVTWESNDGSDISYWNPARIYNKHTITITAATGAGAVNTIKSVVINAGSETYATNTSSNNMTKTVTLPTEGKGSLSATSSSTVATITATGTVTEIKLTCGSSQVRWDSLTVNYEKDQSEVALESISATCSSVLVSQQVSPIVTFSPAGATNKNVTYEFINGTSALADIDGSGVITAKGAGTAKLQITPEDTNADPIVIDITINALPSIYGVAVGTKYAAVSGGYELTGVDTTGTATSYGGDPSNSFPIRVVNGLYANTVALEVTMNEETKYLSYNVSENSNSLDLESSITRESSWIFAEVDDELQIRNVAAYSRILCFYSNANNRRFACYAEATALSADCHAISFEEIPEVKSDREYVRDFVDLYLHLTDYTSNEGYCNDLEHGYYLTAKTGFNSLVAPSDDRVDLFKTDLEFVDAKARYEAWAVANNDAAPYDKNNTVVSKIHAAGLTRHDLTPGSDGIVSIVITASIGAVAAGGVFFLSRRRRDEE